MSSKRGLADSLGSTVSVRGLGGSWGGVSPLGQETLSVRMCSISSVLGGRSGVFV